jgi:hypothetical protein
LDIKGFEHKKGGKATGLPLPYRVTIDKASQQILEIRRNWEDDDLEFQPIKRFVSATINELGREHLPGWLTPTLMYIVPI